MKILATIGIAITAFVTLVFGVISPKKTPAGPIISQSAGPATFYMAAPSPTTRIGEIFPIDIKVKADGMTLSAIATRVNYKYESSLAFEPKDADLKKDGIQLKVSSDLAGKGWVFPINQVYIDSEEKLLTIDLAAVNLSPEGFKVDNEITLATIDVLVVASSPRLALAFDSGETKLLTKGGEEATLQLKDGIFAVR